ncbi:hypothetical protein [Streptomyces sp. NPDC059134]|uniref:hypothetical protein n=1 Tax=Streptomyces sp. NPDC059134 TaxID=3346738 RepID=UPI0036AEBE3E
MLFVLMLPFYVVLIKGLSSDRWLPAWCLVAGGVAGGVCALVLGTTEPYVMVALVFFALAAVALPVTWYRRARRGGFSVRRRP